MWDHNFENGVGIRWLLSSEAEDCNESLMRSVYRVLRILLTNIDPIANYSAAIAKTATYILREG